jgi:8-oxo-dGTP pyrophosphatase MutT (NUDIX family)
MVLKSQSEFQTPTCPWMNLDRRYSMKHPILTQRYISRRLFTANQAPPDDLSGRLPGTPRPAAVLVPLFAASQQDKKSHIWQVLLTRRTNNVADHQGQVAFPGGSSDPSDTSLEMTALREAREEIGLDPSRVRLLGRMKSLWTISNYIVTPVVGVIPWPFPIHLEEVEVSRVFSIPLAWLADPAHHEIRYRSIPLPYSQILGREFQPVIYFKPYDSELLWGISAEITLRLVNILFFNK